MKLNAFTLIELLIALAIMAILAATLFPVAARAKKNAHEADSISNLRQCATAMAIYLEGDDLHLLPSLEQTRKLLARAPTCDAEDYLRRSCTATSEQPLVGSYGYVRGVDEQDAHWVEQKSWNSLLEDLPDPYLFASVYYGDQHVEPFDGNDHNPCIGDQSCYLPSKLIRTRSDTSVKVDSFGPNPTKAKAGNHILFGWSAVFTLKSLPNQ